jgi:CubicO group peptidase (beta-lactamase class C family)
MYPEPLREEHLRGIAVADEPGYEHDPATLRRAFGILEGWIADGVVPGVGALVLHHGTVIGEAYLGTMRRGTDQPVTSDTIWAVASVTKPFTATVTVLQAERGQLSLDEPLGVLIPEFLDIPEPEPHRRAVTLRHCLAHCSGLPGFPPDNFPLRQAQRPLTDFVRSWARQPLLFAPGTMHYYSNPGILLAAESVGRAATGTLGQRLDTPAIDHYHDFVHQEILAPLGMNSSSLLPPAAWDERIAHVSDTGQEGEAYEQVNSPYYRQLGIPWGGLFTTPRDLARFLDLFMPSASGRQRYGITPSERPGPRLLSTAAIREMTTIQFAPPDAPSDLAPDLRDGSPPEFPRPAIPWGTGWSVKGTKRGPEFADFTSPATYSHGGATGTLVWGDPEHDLACVILTNRAMRAGWHTERHRFSHFSNAVIAALK